MIALGTTEGRLKDAPALQNIKIDLSAICRQYFGQDSIKPEGKHPLWWCYATGLEIYSPEVLARRGLLPFPNPEDRGDGSSPASAPAGPGGLDSIPAGFRIVHQRESNRLTL